MILARLKGFLGWLLGRHEPGVSFGLNLKQGIGALFAILTLGVLLDRTGLPLLIAPFGASTLLLFGRPSSPLAQPANLFGGYLISATMAFLSVELFPGVLWATAISLAATLMLMSALRLTHPPAGAIPLIAFSGALDLWTLIEAVAVGSVTLMCLALIYHRIPPRQTYPNSSGAAPPD